MNSITHAKTLQAYYIFIICTQGDGGACGNVYHHLRRTSNTCSPIGGDAVSGARISAATFRRPSRLEPPSTRRSDPSTARRPSPSGVTEPPFQQPAAASSLKIRTPVANPSRRISAVGRQFSARKCCAVYHTLYASCYKCRRRRLRVQGGLRNLVTFRVSRRPREMYCGHARLCVCPRPHAHTIART